MNTDNLAPETAENSASDGTKFKYSLHIPIGDIFEVYINSLAWISGSDVKYRATYGFFS